MTLDELIRAAKDEFWHNASYEDGNQTLANTILISCAKVVPQHVTNKSTAARLLQMLVMRDMPLDTSMLDLEKPTWHTFLLEMIEGSLVEYLSRDKKMAAESSRRDRAYP